jgi:large subunit ribosomal protein L10
MPLAQTSRRKAWPTDHPRPGKAEAVRLLNSAFARSKGLVIAFYGGMSVAELQALRREAKQAHTTIKVAKNTLAGIAAKGTLAEPLVPKLKGQVVLAYSEDPVAPSRVVAEFAKRHSKLVIVAGAIEQTTFDAKGVKDIADLPSLDQSRAKILGQLSAPAAGLARTIQEPVVRLARLAELLSHRPDLASGGGKAEIRIRAAGTGTADEAKSLSPKQTLPSKIAKSLRSKEVNERLAGIKEASRYLVSQEEDSMGVGKGLPPVELLEGDALPERLYDQIFSKNEDEARLAAYALVSGSPILRGKLDPAASPTELNETQQSEFESAFKKLLADTGQPYFPDVDVKPASHDDKEVTKLHVTVRLSRRAPFKIGGHAVLLEKTPVSNKRMRIGSPLAETVGATSSHWKDQADGLVAVGEADMMVRLDRLAGLKLPVVVYFNDGVDTVDLDLDQDLASQGLHIEALRTR